MASPQDTVLQYGVLGAATVVLCVAVLWLARYLVSSHSRERESWKAQLDDAEQRAQRYLTRAEHSEEEFKKLNGELRERLAVALGDTSRAMADAIDVVRNVRRLRDD